MLNFFFAFLIPCLMGNGPTDTSYLTVGSIKTATLEKNKKAEIIIPISVQKGFHVQSNPATEKYLIPTQLTLSSTDEITVGSVTYPEPKPHRLKDSDKVIQTFDGDFLLKVGVSLTDKAQSKGSRSLKGSLRYQACNDRVCFFPKTIPLNVSVKVR